MALLASACAGPSRSTEQQPVPWLEANLEASSAAPAFLWEVTVPAAPDQRLFLTGSIHLARANAIQLPPAMEEAFARSEVLVVELDPATPDLLQKTISLTRALGIYPPPDHLSAHLSPRTRELLGSALARAGLSAQQVEPMRPWLLGTTLSVLELQRIGFNPEHGLDRLLVGWARNRKRIVALETIEQQVGGLAHLPDATQERWLFAVLRDADQMAAEVDRFLAAWQAGDAATMERLFFKDAGDADFGPIYEGLIYARNRTMAEKIATLVSAPETHFVAVGAAHVVGPQGIVALLQQRGFRVRQVPRAVAGRGK